MVLGLCRVKITMQASSEFLMQVLVAGGFFVFSELRFDRMPSRPRLTGLGTHRALDARARLLWVQKDQRLLPMLSPTKDDGPRFSIAA
jgi:hypothetical protein